MGSGPKPRQPFAPEAIDGGKSPLAEPPVDLPEPQRAFWRQWARHAVEAGTLNDRTSAGWRLLCNLEARMRRYEEQLERDGDTFEKVVIDGSGQEHRELKAHPLVAKHLALANKVDGLMSKFRLTAFGKAESVPRPKTSLSPWAKVAGQ